MLRTALVDSLLEIMSMHGAGKLKSGVCRIYPTTNFLHCPPRMDMIALNEYFPAKEPKGGHSSFHFQWHTATPQWWDDLGPAHHEVPPLHHIPDITLPTLHQTCGLSWYRGLADPPPLHYPRTPFANQPLAGLPCLYNP